MNRDVLQKVLAYVDCHIFEKISLCDLSEIAGYSPFYFSKLFSEAMGMPVTGYIRIRKLQHAIVDLLEGQKVLDVALRYAFDSHEGFTRAFTQLFGSSPSKIRKFLSTYTLPAYSLPDINRRNDMEPTNSQHNLHQLLFEVLKESLQEAEAGFCNKIQVAILPEGYIRVCDNGRGIPLSGDLTVSPKVLDKILAGSPITNAEYSQMGDLSGAGLQTVNSLCEALQVTVIRDGCRFRQDYVRGVAQHELQVEELASESGMELLFRPDRTIFKAAVFSPDTICSWLNAQATTFPGLHATVQIGV